MFTISKEFHFEAAHALTHLPSDHKCYAMHGHSYRVELVSESRMTSHLGWVHDFGDFDRFKTFLDEQYDHKVLNDVLGNSINTTAEMLAMQLFRVARMLGLSFVVEVRVHETAKTCAVYRVDGEDDA